MQRWHLTLGLTATALGAALIAPRLLGSKPEQVPPPVPLDVPQPPQPPVVVTPPAVASGHLVVSAGNFGEWNGSVTEPRTMQIAVRLEF